MSQNSSRRKFIKSGLATAAGLGVLSHAGTLSRAEQLSVKVTRGAMPKRVLGKTGFEVSLFSLGGQSTIEQPNRLDDAVAIINRALDLGVNYIDTAAYYGQGISERYIGEVMKERRNEVFLATKTLDRTYDGAMREIERSLKNLQTDQVDLYQVHNVRTQRDLDLMFAERGVVKAMERLRDEGVVRYIGITGHRDPEVLRKGLLEFDFDCILMALNAADIHYAPFQTDLLATAVEQNLGIIAMKVPAHGRIFRGDGVTNMRQALGYVYTFPISTAIVGITTIEELEENVQITREFEPYSDGEMETIAGLTAHYHEDASWFKLHW